MRNNAVIIGLLLVLFIMVGLNTYMLINQNNSKSNKSDKNNEVISPVVEPTIAEKYPLKRKIFATMFWVGEGATTDNAFISNHASSWDVDWEENFGGVDSPTKRNGFYPSTFKPLENPFYFALPYNDLSENGTKKLTAKLIPWADQDEGATLSSALKNRWIKVIYGKNTCYGQWEDVGPFESDDYEYVFGDQPSINRVGIDLSPAFRTCLDMKTNDFVDWQFVDERKVPDGPWKEIVTTRPLSW